MRDATPATVCCDSVVLHSMHAVHRCIWSALVCLLPWSREASAAEPLTPIIYSADLCHAPADPDDHFDTAVDSTVKILPLPVNDTDYRSLMESALNNLAAELGRQP